MDNGGGGVASVVAAKHIMWEEHKVLVRDLEADVEEEVQHRGHLQHTPLHSVVGQAQPAKLEIFWRFDDVV
jgi:saccharopine dehydrogenase-like NADP-dependent oxidoreductase